MHALHHQPGQAGAPLDPDLLSAHKNLSYSPAHTFAGLNGGGSPPEYIIHSHSPTDPSFFLPSPSTVARKVLVYLGFQRSIEERIPSKQESLFKNSTFKTYKLFLYFQPPYCPPGLDGAWTTDGGWKRKCVKEKSQLRQMEKSQQPIVILRSGYLQPHGQSKPQVLTSLKIFESHCPSVCLLCVSPLCVMLHVWRTDINCICNVSCACI